MSIAEKARAFLRAHELDASALDAEAIQAAYIEEMERGLAGEDSSLAMIPTYVTIDRPVPADTPVAVMDAGGTNVRVATVSFSQTGEPKIGKFHKHSMPGIKHHVSKDEFFAILADHLRPVLDDFERMGFCFSYATEITPDCDGKLLYWTKEIKAPDVVGTMVGANLNEKLVEAGNDPLRIVILNDTIATLLAGKSAGKAREYETYTGVILGTGSNTAYVEKNENITKIPDLPSGSMAINLESGGFARAPRSDFDRMLDDTTINPGKQMFEKMISGAYMGGVGLQILRTAADEGLLSDGASAVVHGWEDLSTKDMDDFLQNPFREGPFRQEAFTQGDLEMMMHLLAEVVKRAALLVAVNISSPLVKTEAGKNPLHPACVTVDGSTFYKTENLKSMVEEHLRELLGSRGIYYELIKVDEAPVLGAAVAGLTV